MSKHLRALVIGLVLGSFGLFSCSEKNPAASADNEATGGFGRAVVHLPDLSSSALSKTAVGIDTNALTLLIVAPDMDTIKYSWPVTKLNGQIIHIDGIPAGSNRYFEGFLTNKSGVLTHSGKVAVRIIAGQDVPVNLKLSGVGGADVCIEIDGYPSSCNYNDSLYINSCLNGATPSGYLNGNIRLFVYGERVSGQITIVTSEEKSTFMFNRPVKIIDSVFQKYCETVVFNYVTGKNYGLKMVVNQNSEIEYGYLCEDTNALGIVIAKFYSVQCQSVDSLNINSCLNGSTLEGPLTGNFQLYVYKEKVSGQFTIVGSKKEDLYLFTRPVRIIDSTYQKYCETVVLNTQMKTNHFLQFVVDDNSMIQSAYLSADTNKYGMTIAKFYSTKCQIFDTININSCLSGYTPDDSLTGNIKLTIIGDMPYGRLTLVTSTDKNTYEFKEPVQITYTGNKKHCEAVVVNLATGVIHGLIVDINEYSEITYGYLSGDGDIKSVAIAKFFSDKCPDITPDTTKVAVDFKGYISYPDSVIFKSFLNLDIVDNKARGTILFDNHPLIESIPLKVTGEVYFDEVYSGFMELTAYGIKSYSITVKIHDGMYEAVIYDDKGYDIGYMQNR